MSPSEERVAEIESLRGAGLASRVPSRSTKAFGQTAPSSCMRPDHVEPEFERVVAKTPRYAIVRKFGRHLAAMVLRLDPRRRPAV